MIGGLCYTLPMTILAPKKEELEVHFKTESNKAIIEGKTTVPFQAFVTLILQRKVFSLFKEWGRQPVIVSSELLTSLASAPQDSMENRSRLILVSLGVGLLAGVAIFALVQAGLLTLTITLGREQLLLIGGGIVGVAVLAALLIRLQRMRRSDKIVEAVESLSSFLSK